MIQIRWYMTGLSDGDADMGTLAFATEGEASAFERGARSIQDPPGTEYMFNTEIEGKWFDAGRSDAKSCVENGYGIRTERIGTGEPEVEPLVEEPAAEFVPIDKGEEPPLQRGNWPTEIIWGALALGVVLCLLAITNLPLRSNGEKLGQKQLSQEQKIEIKKIQQKNLARTIPIGGPSVLQGQYQYDGMSCKDTAKALAKIKDPNVVIIMPVTADGRPYSECPYEIRKTGCSGCD